MHDEPRPGSPNDFRIVWGTVSCMSGAGGLGGTLGAAVAKGLHGGGMAIVALVGLLFGAAVLWAVWYVGVRAIPPILARLGEPTIVWRRVLPVMHMLLFISMLGFGALGAILTQLLIKHVTR